MSVGPSAYIYKSLIRVTLMQMSMLPTMGLGFHGANSKLNCFAIFKNLLILLHLSLLLLHILLCFYFGFVFGYIYQCSGLFLVLGIVPGGAWGITGYAGDGNEVSHMQGRISY